MSCGTGGGPAAARGPGRPAALRDSRAEAGSRAASLLGAAEALREAIGTVIAPCERALREQTVAGGEPRSARRLRGRTRVGLRASVD